MDILLLLKQRLLDISTEVFHTTLKAETGSKLNGDYTDYPIMIIL
jgi:hypothetical protein